MRHEKSIQLIPDDLSRIDSVALSELRKVTPAVLGQYDVLGARCGVCKHEGRIDRQQLIRRWPGISLIDLEQRLSCRHCRNGMGNKFLVTGLPRD